MIESGKTSTQFYEDYPLINCFHQWPRRKL